MATVSERARELAEKYVGSTCMEHCWCQYSEKNGDDYVSCEDKLAEAIEQALLAERRLAMAFCAEIADDERNLHCRLTLLGGRRVTENRGRPVRGREKGGRELTTMTETTNSPTKPNEPACPECSRLASRVEELEKFLREILDDCVVDRKKAEMLLSKHPESLNSADSASNAESSTTAKETR